MLAQPLWAGASINENDRNFFSSNTGEISLGQDFDLWIDWYRRRLKGDPSGFGLPPAGEEELSRRLIEATDEWWKREPALVNGDIKAWIRELGAPFDFDAIKARVEGGAVPQFGSVEEREQRSALQQQIEALQAELANVDLPPAPIGHNRPPVELEQTDAHDVPAVICEVRDLATDLKTAIEPAAPALPIAVEKLSRLQRLGRWLTKLFKGAIEDFISEAAKTAGKSTGLVVGPVIAAAILAVIYAAWQWLQTLNLAI